MPTKTAVAMTPDRVGNRPLKMRDLQTAISLANAERMKDQRMQHHVSMSRQSYD